MVPWYVHIEDWRNRPLQGGRYPYVYVDGIYLRRNWGGEFENVAILVAIAVNEDGYREVLGAAEGMKEDKASWVSFFQWLRGRGLDGVKLVVGDKYQKSKDQPRKIFQQIRLNGAIGVRHLRQPVPKGYLEHPWQKGNCVAMHQSPGIWFQNLRLLPYHTRGVAA